ncbi:MAG: putative rane protein [Anaerocolumna sp.]|jgi:murein DD-endopeptidase MepM/ murein hydrolase activator NlpD|nr:putative rane protein [Anaerocolumna sp.]
MKKFNIKHAIIGELVVVLVLSSFLIYQHVREGSIDTFYPNSEKNYIKWVDFDICSAALGKAYEYDVASQTEEIKLNWIELLSYLGTRYGGDFSRYKEKDLNALVQKLKNKEETMGSITEGLKYYDYYLEAYTAVLGGFVGEYEIQVNSEENPEEKVWVKKYGLKAFLPVAKFFPYSDYDDFGVSRSYGYKRKHLGHDMMGQVGTPIVAVESGWVEALGWNQYGGWRIGIRSFDGKRYYYYAHLRKNFPYNKALEVGSVVQAGDVIGYLGRTGYSRNENVNNIDTPHLHFGMQLIFDESQKEGYNEIWIDCYDIINFLYRNRSETVKNTETKEWSRVFDMKDPSVQDYLNNKDKYPDPTQKRNLDDDPGDENVNPDAKGIEHNSNGNDTDNKNTDSKTNSDDNTEKQNNEN